MKSSSFFLLALLASPAAFAQEQSQITIVSDPSTWYPQERTWDEHDIRWQNAPPPELFIEHPEITSIPGPIPMHWNVTRLDPWTEAKVVTTHEGWKVVTWGNNRVLPNLRYYHQSFGVLSKGKSYYIPQDLPHDHAYIPEFKLIDTNHDGRVSQVEHQAFQQRKVYRPSKKHAETPPHDNPDNLYIR